MTAPAVPNDPILRARCLSIQRGGRTLVAVKDLALYGGDVHVLLGLNGAGKSTLLHALNGLEQADGELFFQGRQVRSRRDRLVLRRGTAAVFQEPNLFNTTVRANVESGLRVRGVSRAEARARAAAALELLHVGHLGGRRTTKLSGGEAQRVSIARALAVQPAALFLDEPLTSLDPPTRRTLVHDLLAILHNSSMAVIWVTHDRDEALAVGNMVTYLEDGEVVQTGPTPDVFARPATKSLAEFLGLDVFLTGRVVHDSDGATRLLLDGGAQLFCADAPDGPAVAAIAPEDVVLFSRRPAGNTTSLRNMFDAEVKEVTRSGRLLRVDLEAQAFQIAALITPAASEDLGIVTGAKLVAGLKAAAVHPVSRRKRQLAR